jgi:hypothetical protein
MPNERIDAVYTAFCDACVRFWLMPGGALGDGPVDHLPVSEDFFGIAFRDIPQELTRGFSRGYTGLRDVVRFLADEQPPGWKRLVDRSDRYSLGFLLVAAMSEGNPADRNFHARLTTELGTDRRASDLERDLEGLWGRLARWVERERHRTDSEYHGLRPMMLSTYAESMTRIGTTIELAFPNRADRKALEPVIQRLSVEVDPPVAVVVSELGRIISKAEPLLQRAIAEFQSDPFKCTGVAGCLKAIITQRLSAGIESKSDDGSSVNDVPELLFYRHDDGLLMPYLALEGARDGYDASSELPYPWTNFRQVSAVDITEEAAAIRIGLRPSVVRAIARGSLGLMKIDGNWFAGAGRVSADAQDAILIKTPPADLEGCSPGFAPGWFQWFRRDNHRIQGLVAVQDQVGLLRTGIAVDFTGGVRLAHTGTYLHVAGFGPRVASSNAAWWTAHRLGGGDPVTLQGQEIDARSLAEGSWACQGFDAMGKSIGDCRIDLVGNVPLACSFPQITEHDRVECNHPEQDAAEWGSSFLRCRKADVASGNHVGCEGHDDSGKWYFGAIAHSILTDECGARDAAKHFASIRADRDDLLRVLIGRSCNRANPVGWGAFADDLRAVMDRRQVGRWNFRHAGSIIRAWEESGFIDVVNRPWTGLCIIPRQPRWTFIHDRDELCRAVATGLLSPHQRSLLLGGLDPAAVPGFCARLKHSINAYVPSVVQVEGKGDIQGLIAIGREIGFADPEHLSSGELHDALVGTEPFSSTAARLLSMQLDRRRFAEDDEPQPPTIIGNISVQRTRARGTVSRWFLDELNVQPGNGAMTTSRNWAYLLARYRSGIGRILAGSGGLAVQLRDDLPDAFMPIGVGRALALCGPRLPGPFMKGSDRFYGVPMGDALLKLISPSIR